MPAAPTVPEMAAPAPVGPEVMPAAPTVPEMAAPTPVSPEVMPAGPEMVASAPVVPEMPAPATQPGQPVIYGGANPTATVSDVNVTNNQPHQIYGGADPLENTQPMPAVQTIQSVQPVAPVPNPVAVAPDVISAVPVQQ